MLLRNFFVDSMTDASRDSWMLLSTGCEATTSGPGSDQLSVSGSDGTTSGKGLERALSAFCLVILSWIRKIPSLIFRPRYSTIAGCQSACDLRNCAIRLPANRYLARAVLNRSSCSSFSPCCAERYALRKISLGSSCCPTRTRVAPMKRTRASKAAASRLTRWRGAKISQLRAEFRSTGGENYRRDRRKSSPLFAKKDSNFKILFLRQ